MINTIKNNILLFVVFLIPAMAIQAETTLLLTSFSTNPTTDNGTVTICQGQSITYTNTSTGVGSNPTFAWTFQGGSTISITGIGPHTITYNTAGTFTTTLTVNGSSSNVNVIVTAGTPSNPIITVTPNIGWAVTSFNSTNYFNYCADGATGGLFMFSTNSTNTNTNSQHIIDWGDGSPVSTTTSANITDDFHVYATNGIFQITYTVILQSGCSYTKTYNIFIGANPTASIINNGVPVLCNPGSVQYSIIPGAQNTFGTIYTFQVNDSTPAQTFTHAQVITPGFSVTHNFNTVSCNTSSNINGTVYPNSFQASITVSNPCGTSSSAIGPINIQSKPIASISANPASSQICLNTSVVFTDTTIPGTNIGSSPTFTCSQTYKRYWQITGPSGIFTVPATGILPANSFISVVGNLGFNANLPNNPSIWTSTASNALNITFNTPGTYSITLFTSGSNSCGISSQTKTICVNPEVIADFTVSSTEACAPTTVTLDNLSSLPGCSNANVYAWQVTHTNPQNCPNATSPGWSFTSGSASSFEPEITFTSAGVYNVQLTTSLQSAVAGALCQPDITTQTITIKDKPRTTLTPQTICEGTTITLNPTVFNCYATQAVIYTWDFLSNPAVTISDINAANPTITFAVPGIYNYTLKLENECGFNTFSSVINVNPAVQITASGPTATCLNTGIPLIGSITGGSTTGIWTASITGGTFSPNATTALSPTYTPPANFVGTITFTLTSADPAGPCTAKTISFQVDIDEQATAEAGTYNPVCQNGSLPLNGSVGGAASSGSWTSSNGGTFSDATSLTSSYSPPAGFIGTIDLTLTTNDPPGPCEPETDTVTITVIPSHIISTQPTTTQSVCVGGTIGPLTVAYSGGVGTATYQWYSNTTNSNSGGTLITGATNISYTPAPFTTAGTYYFYATITLSGNGCGSTTSNTAEVIVVADPVVDTQALTTQTLCQNSIPTDLTISVSGGIGTFAYQWYSNTANNNAGGTLIAGANNSSFTPPTTTVGTQYYYCEITQTGVGCNVTSAIAQVIIVPAPAISTQPQSSSVCENGTPTLLTLAYTNGTGTPTYQWFSNTTNNTIGGTAIAGANSDSYSPPSTTVGTLYYYCEITFSSGGCTSVLSNTAQVIINQNPVINNVTAIVCSGEQYIFNSTNSGDVLPAGIQYSWNLVSITPAGTATGSVNNGTLQNQFIQQLVNNSNEISTLVFNVTPIAGICTGNNFTITIEVYPKPNVIFDLANQTICNNTTTNLVTLSSSLPGAITFAWTANIPTGISGAIASGTGNIPVQTLVNSTNSPLTITYTAAATFTSNGNSCTGNDAFYTITVNPTFTASGVLSNFNGYNVSVFGGNDGSINLTVAGGDGTYTYDWVGPNGFTATTENLTGLFAGTYTVTINDGYCAPIVLTFTLTQPPELLVQQDPALSINLLCFGDSNGAVGILITQESVSPYDYTLLNSANVSVQTIANSTNLNPQFTGLIAGTYSVLVTDANGGIKTVTGLVVSQPNDIVITPTITEITCYGANNASISLAVTGGTAPYQANWSNLATGFFQNNLAAGSYTITITDANGCPKPITINIIEAPIFTINPVVTIISCCVDINGSINLNLIGGQAPVTLTWSDGSTSGTVRNNLLPGTYSVSISDGTPCYINRTFIIVEPQPLVLNATVQNALDCLNPNSGAINLVVSGGTPPFTYAWSNGATTEDLTAITNGNYSVVVTDSRGCIKTASYTVFRPQPLIVVLDQNSQVNCSTGTVTNLFKANVSGGMAPFTINWSSGTISGTNNEFMSTTQNGLITVTITDANGCTTSQSVTISNPIIGNAGFGQNSFAYTTYGIYSINDPIQFTNTATGDFVSVAWNFGDGIFSTEENPIHTYVLEGNYIVTQTVTYPLGCIKITIITLIITKGYKLIIPSGFTANNDTINDTFKPEFEGLENISLQVYDTWGNVVYYEKGETIVGWNGQINSVPAENGNYYYKVIGTTFYGELIEKNGPFTLIK